jgi:hypothetical protein
VETACASRTILLAVAAWAALITVAHVWGRVLSTTTRIGLRVPPLHSSWRPRPGAATVAASATAALAVVVVPRLVRRLPWRAIPPLSAIAATVWAVALASTDGVAGLTRGVATSDYRAVAGQIDAPLAFLDRFTELLRAGDLPTHTSGHPPGFVLVLWTLDRLGLRADAWGAALCIGGGAVGVALVIATVREVAGEATARAAVPFAVLSPAAIWIATTPDAFFAGVAATTVWTIALATRPGRSRAAAIALAAIGGILFAATLMLSYGLLLMAAIPIAIAWARMRWWPLLVAAGVAAAAIVALGATGFWWPDGLLATRDRYWQGLASTRPLRYFVVANLAALALTCGPAVAAGLTRLREHERGLGVIVAGALGAILAANLSALSKGEVERIWLPFAIWVLPAAASLAARPRLARSFLAVQAATAIGIQTLVHNA